MNESFAYTGRELEVMADAHNYHRWILEIFQPYLGQHLLEVGAGLGSFSELILRWHTCQTLTLVEPSKPMYELLVTRIQRLKTDTRVEAVHGTFASFASQLKTHPTPDSIIYVNVLEHIDDDEAELVTVCQSLSTKGRVLIFVPALSWLFGRFDERIGHFRRYAKDDLEAKLQRAGFSILRLAYFDLPGILPWWIKYRVLRSEAMEPEAVRFYDRFIVPTVRLIERRLSPPIGKNIIAIAQKV